MAITENWYAQGLGVEGKAGWNKYGSFWLSGAAGRCAFVVNVLGLSVICDGNEAYLHYNSLYSGHGLTSDTNTTTFLGPTSCNYSLWGMDAASIRPSLITIATSGEKRLWIRDSFEGTGKRIIGFGTSTALGSLAYQALATPPEISGRWDMDTVGFAANYLGTGTWQGSFWGTNNGTGTVCMVNYVGAGDYLPSNAKIGIRHEASELDTGTITWSCSTLILPFSHCEWSEPSTVSFVGTWWAGGVEQVGYLPLGDRLITCSDIVDYAFLPLEYRGWSSSCTLSLADNDQYIRNNVLGYLTGTTHQNGSIVLKQTWDGGTHWSTLFSGVMNEQPVYDYFNRTVEFSLESTLSSLQNKTFTKGKLPFVTSTVGVWQYSKPRGTHVSIKQNDGLFPNMTIYPASDSENEFIVEAIAAEYTMGTNPVTFQDFTLKGNPSPYGFLVDGLITGYKEFPTSFQVDEIRNSPAVLLNYILSNAGIQVEQDALYTAWGSVVANTYLGEIPKIAYTSELLPLFNEVCAALNTAYTVSPEGRLRLFSFDAEPSNPTEINLSEHSSNKFTITTYSPIGEVDVAYGFDAENNGPDKSVSVSTSSTSAMHTTESISTRFLDSNIAAIVAGYRAIRRFENAIPVISLQCEGSRWASELTGGGVYVMGAGDFLGSAAPIFGAWSIISKAYNWTSDQTTLTLMGRFPTREWVTWGSTVEWNTGMRWF